MAASFCDDFARQSLIERGIAGVLVGIRQAEGRVPADWITRVAQAGGYG
jgi:hypothetical protein